MTQWKIVTPDMISIVTGPPPCDDTGWLCRIVRDYCRAKGLTVSDPLGEWAASHD